MGDFLSDIKTLRARARQQIEEGPITESYGADRDRVIGVLNEALAARSEGTFAGVLGASDRALNRDRVESVSVVGRSTSRAGGTGGDAEWGEYTC
jgi:hypothetical protein